MTPYVDGEAHPLGDPSYRAQSRRQLDAHGALVLEGFLRPAALAAVVDRSLADAGHVFYADATHNVWLTGSDPSLDDEHVFNRQIVSTKGLLADDQIPADSPLRAIYDDTNFRSFLCAVLGIDAIHPYADPLSSINVHFADEGRELGWHFDNSSFAVTLLLQAPAAGGVFEYVPAARDSATGDQGFAAVGDVLDGTVTPQRLDFSPGDLVLFRGRDALHRVTPTQGDTTRLLVVFAYNDAPDVSLSESAMQTFYGRVATA